MTRGIMICVVTIHKTNTLSHPVSRAAVFRMGVIKLVELGMRQVDTGVQNGYPDPPS